ncbi:MAG: rhodanese-like domain-containing protein [Cyclobacteriaceae bacterium]|nr:rhodanese-like domain-containing protein [Cyclobacteriaceae bacterium]
MEQEVNCIEKSEVLALSQNGKVVVLDVRSEEEYLSSHIEGALNITMDTISENIAELKTADLVVTACGKGGGRSSDMARFLKDRGLNSRWLCNGTFGWLE